MDEPVAVGRIGPARAEVDGALSQRIFDLRRRGARAALEQERRDPGHVAGRERRAADLAIRRAARGKRDGEGCSRRNQLRKETVAAAVRAAAGLRVDLELRVDGAD